MTGFRVRLEEQKIVIYAIYRSPNTNVNLFIKELRDSLEKPLIEKK